MDQVWADSLPKLLLRLVVVVVVIIILYKKNSTVTTILVFHVSIYLSSGQSGECEGGGKFMVPSPHRFSTKKENIHFTTMAEFT